MTFPTLPTPRLRLVEVQPEHAHSIYDVFSNREVMQYYGMDPLQEVSQAEKIVRHMQSNYETQKGIRWAIMIEDEDQFAGTIGLNNLALGMKKAEVGFEIHPDYWRKGITSEALQAVLDYSFKKLGLHRMGAVTFLENDASIGLLEKHGFTKEGLLRSYLFQNGESHDAFLFSLLHTEWDPQ